MIFCGMGGQTQHVGGENWVGWEDGYQEVNEQSQAFCAGVGAQKWVAGVPPTGVQGLWTLGSPSQRPAHPPLELAAQLRPAEALSVGGGEHTH